MKKEHPRFGERTPVPSNWAILRKEGVFGFIVLLAVCSIIWGVFLSYSWGTQFVPHIGVDDDTMHKTVIYYMLNGEDFYSAWRHAALTTGDLGDLRIYRTPFIFYPMVFLTGWAGSNFVFPLSMVCVSVAAMNLILTFWSVRSITTSGWAALAATFVQSSFFFNIIPLFQISLFAMPFLILGTHYAYQGKPWLAGIGLAFAFLIKETYAFALPAFIVLFFLRHQWREIWILLSIFGGAVSFYLLHTLIAQPIPDPQMMLNASAPIFILNLAGFLWFGFGVLAYNVLAPATFPNYYPTNPVLPFIPIPLFYGLLILQIILIWGTLSWWLIGHIKQKRTPPIPLSAFALVLWIVPVIFAATTHIDIFSLYWMDYAIWRWFAPSIVGFQLLVAMSWSNLRSGFQRWLYPSKTFSVNEAEITRNLNAQDVPFDTQAL